MTRAPKRTTNDGVPRPSVDCERSRSGRPGRPRSAEEYAAQLEAVMENVEEGMVLCDADGCVLRMNRRAREMHEYASLEQTWRSVPDYAETFELYTPEGSSIPPAEWPLNRAIRGETFHDLGVRIHNKRTGTDRSVRCRSAPVKDSRGHVVVAMLAMQELDAQSRPWQGEDESRLQSIFRAAPVGIGLVANRVLRDVNERLCEMLGYRPEELVGRNSRILYPTQEEWEHVGREKYRQIRERGTGTVETRWRRKDGAVLDILLSSTPLDLEDLSRGVTFTALDITDRKKAENELRSVFNLSLDMICIADIRTGAFTKVNPAFQRTLGYGEQELLSRPFAEFIHPDDLDSTMAVLRERLRLGERVLNFENRFRCKDGSYRWLNWTSHPQVEQGLTYAIARDVTEQKRMERALEESLEHEKALGDLVRYASVGICMGPFDGRLDCCNPAFCELTGHTQEELSTINWNRDLTPPEWREPEAAKLAEAVRTKRVVRYEKEYFRKDGSRIPVELVVHPEFDSEGKLRRCFAFITDITERKRAEEALRFTQFAVDHTADAAFWMNRNAEFCYVNEAACRALDYSRDELLQMTVYDIDPAFTKDMWVESWRTLQAKKSLILETVHRTRDGRTYPVEIRANYVEFGGQDYDCAFARDITERKGAEEALRESEARHRRLMENLKGSHFVYRHDMEGVFRYVSESLTGILGYTPDEFMTHYARYLTDHPVNQAVHRHTELTLQGIPQPPYEINTWHKDGSTRWLEVQEVPVFDDEGRVVAVEGVAQDITERRQAEEALREKEYLLSESQRIGHIGTWSVDLTTNVATWTSETYRLYGVSPETFVPSAETLLSLLHPDDRDAMREWMRAALAGERPDVLESRVVLPDGSIRILSGRGELICDDDNKPLRLVGTAQDVTERKRAEETLKASETRFRSIVNSSPLGMHLYELRNDDRLVFVGANPAADEILGVDHAQLIGKTIEEAFPGLDCTDVPARYREAARHGALWRTEQIDYRDGRIGGAFEVVAFQTEPGKMVAVFNDITERKQAEEALRRLNESLEQQVAQRTRDLTHTVARLQQLTWELSQAEDRERRRIADLLHDDVQQILAGARFHLNLLSIEARSPEESREIIDQVRQMLKDAIEKARSLSHELSPALYQVDLADILGWLGDHMRRKHGLIVHVEAHGLVDPSSDALKALLYKVAQELLFNVVKHAGVKEARVRVRRMGRCLCLSVTDRGSGFDPRELEKTAGFGLLSIRERVHLLGGRMKIRSTPGAGSRFLVAVPDEGPSQPMDAGRERV